MTASVKEVIAAAIPIYNGCSRDAISDVILAALDAAGLVVVPRGAHDALVAALEKSRWYVEAYDTREHNNDQDADLTQIDAAMAMARKP